MHMLDPLWFIHPHELKLKEMCLTLEFYTGGLTSGEAVLLCLDLKCCTSGVIQSRCESSDPSWVSAMAVVRSLF